MSYSENRFPLFRDMRARRMRRSAAALRADEPDSGASIISAFTRVFSTRYARALLKWPRWPLALLASAARADEPDSGVSIRRAHS
jgi:hypothetical protein